MTKEEKEVDRVTKKLCRYLAGLSWVELRELKISGQQQKKIKDGKTVRFYKKSFERLRKLVA